ncbi:MAG: TRAP transporter large permease subunit [Comamonas sp.]|nr:TRAP transporter large permease subunit [Comamonas sp.]
MNEIYASIALIVVLLVLLSGGVWVGLTLAGVAWFGMEFFTPRSAGDAMAMTIWSSASSWTLTALPLFVWMGEILYRTNLSESMFRGLAPWVNALPGRLLHTNVIGCTIFASVSGSSAATCATVGKMNIPELRKRGYPESQIIGSLGGPATLGLLIPPSIILIVYGVSAEISISKLFMAGVLPGLMLAVLFSGWIIVWALLNPGKVPKADSTLSFKEKIYEARHLIPVIVLIASVVASIYSGIATATEAAGIGVAGALILSASQKALSWESFKASLFGATRLYCMIALILAGAAFMTLSMGYIGLPRQLAEYVGSLNLSPAMLIVVLGIFYILIGCFLDGISTIVLTMSVVLPIIQAAGIDPLWFGIFLVITVEAAQITPPVGFNLFVLQSMTGKQITYIAKVCAPYFGLMVVALAILWFFPEIATALPSKM